MKRLVRGLALAALGVTASVAVAASPAHASLGTCHSAAGERYYINYCEGSRPTSFRVWVYCTNGYFYYGPWEWAGDGQASEAQCPTNVFVVDFDTAFAAQ
jgi:hypothetical protein